ncbi:hypothetical protein LTR85_010130 [Meristemomyces frigidus]|nr:hypothetical protein LTR85_010130 [Meristemomyces frigidus]
MPAGSVPAVIGAHGAVNGLSPNADQVDQSTSEPVILDALVVGAGFAGVHLLKKLRDEGYSAKLVEAGSDYGGVWYWNRYPGARVDIPGQQYQLADPALWTDWSWKQRFPGSAELRAYFAYVAEKYDLRKDSLFDQSIISAVWQSTEQRWLICTDKGMTFKAKFFLPCVGFSAKRYMPDWKGVEKFKGVWMHPSHWPKEDLDEDGKRVAIIGTGATGVQLVQQISQKAKELVAFQRTPAIATPMVQVDFKGTEQSIPRDQYAASFAAREVSFSGVAGLNFLPKAAFDHTPEQRKEVYERAWEEGDFTLWLGTYYDTLFSPDANTEAYNFWRGKTRPRIDDPRKKNLLAPMVKAHSLGVKRMPLEQGYYVAFNQPNVHLVDTNETPVVEVTECGINTTERAWDFDFVICATGYDAITGGLLHMGICGEQGVTVPQKWESGVKTSMGMATGGFPNMFFPHGPQGPTAFCNGPMCAEMQGNWIVNLMSYMRANGAGSVQASKESEEQWAVEVSALANASLLPGAKSWYMGANIPGKRRELLVYLGGVPEYYKRANACADKGYEGFEFQ